MNKSLPELMDDILTQINEQFEEVIQKLTKRLADLAADAHDRDHAQNSMTDTSDGAGN